MWSFDAVADAIAAELELRDRALRDEQAVRGLDSLDELQLHPIAEKALNSAGFGVLREQPYPHEWRRKIRPGTSAGEDAAALPEHRDRRRCDFVLTEHPGQKLDDAWSNERSERTRRKQLRGTLFEDAAVSPSTQESAAVNPEDVLWLECKLVTQFDCASGAAGPNRSYASQIVRGPVTDLVKLADDPQIMHAGIVLVVFTQDAVVAEHDLTTLAHKCLDRDLPLLAPVRRTLSIPDRMGNGVCSVWVLGMRKAV